MTLTTFLQSLHPDIRGDTTAPGGDPALPGGEHSETDSAAPASVLCARVTAKWLRRHRTNVEVRHGDELARARTNSVPADRLVVHAHRLCVADLLTAARLGAGHIVVGSPRDVTLLAAAELPSVQMLLRTVDGGGAGRDMHRRLHDVVVAQSLTQPRLRLVGLHADIGSDAEAFISVAAAVGQMIGTMADLRERHGLVMSGLSVSIDTELADVHRHAVNVDTALRDACLTLSYPVPSVILSVRTRDHRSHAA